MYKYTHTCEFNLFRVSLLSFFTSSVSLSRFVLSLFYSRIRKIHLIYRLSKQRFVCKRNKVELRVCVSAIGWIKIKISVKLDVNGIDRLTCELTVGRPRYQLCAPGSWWWWWYGAMASFNLLFLYFIKANNHFLFRFIVVRMCCHLSFRFMWPEFSFSKIANFGASNLLNYELKIRSEFTSKSFLSIYQPPNWIIEWIGSL